MIHYYKTHLLLVAKVNARVCIKFCKIAFTFANDDRLFIVRGRVYFPAHYFAKCRFSEGQGSRNFASFYYTSFYTFSILYPMPICVWIYCGESGSDSSFLRSVAINTRSEATSLSQELPQTSWVI